MSLGATVAGLMRKSYLDLPRFLQQRLVLPGRHSGSLPGGALAAPAQFLSSRARVERLAAELSQRAAAEGRPTPLTLRTARAREDERREGGAILMASERGLVDCMEQINAAAAGGNFVRRTLVASRGGQGGNAGAADGAETERGDEAERGALSLETLDRVDLNARRLSEPLFMQAFEAIAAAADPLGARLMAGGCCKCAGSFLNAVPMTPVFTLKPWVFVTSLQRYNGVAAMSTPHTHHCGQRGQRVLSAANATHIFSCPCLGGFIKPHNAVKFDLAHAVHQCGATSTVPLTEVFVMRGGLAPWKADIQFVDENSGLTYVIDVSVVNIDSTTSLRRVGGFGDVEAALLEEERAKRDLPTPRRIIDEEGNSTIFVPFIMSSSGGFGPAARSFLKHLYRTSRERGKWLMGQGQPEVHTTWNTLYASTYWDMRLSVACTSMSAEVVGRLLVRDTNLNMAVDPRERQPPRDPNWTPYASAGPSARVSSF